METKKKLIGFAALSPEERKSRARQAALALHASGKATYPFRDDHQLAVDAGRLGGKSGRGEAKARPQKKKGES